ncbi:hypothetical protein F5Y00DRAFT_258066 [Daldinia vernicosa]|uniref:uncharacterized protein n=1 Tax=Daldinia vernicosa TaxID=114800 RepID=UPI002007E5B7|nr:uncharacterized protein F5Y00DRAFT_258066 [Daldinia vernicosa]KAI0852810.1 hypothetical protein F5Y00DRAFT_258066 [Daldinia vernicosa]
MADITTNGIEKGANSEAATSASQPSIPPVAKTPINAGEESMEPSIATNTAAPGAATAPDSETPAQNDVATTGSKELIEKMDAADTLASQPEKSAETVPAESTTTEIATDTPSLTNGEAKEPPKPVTIEEVRDEDTPAAAESQPAEMTGALPVQEPANDTPKAEPAPVTAEPDKSEANTGEKRKPSESKASNGDATQEESPEEPPAEKKQKTNGANTNGTSKKVGRPKKESKKDKKAPVPVGRTARKTRSQGAADQIV